MKRRSPDPLASVSDDERFEDHLRELAAMSPAMKAKKLKEIDRKAKRERAGQARESFSERDMEGADCIEPVYGDVLPSVRMFGGAR